MHGAPVELYEPYADETAMTETVAWLGRGALALPATIVTPNGRNAKTGFPLVIFVHGSGGGDRDDAVGHMRPFRDLADGLTTQGVASLRWVKRTHMPYARISKLDPKTLTLKEEYFDDVTAAIALAKTVPGVDPKRIFIAGHSEGGWITPWILTDHPDVAGGITLAGNARNFALLLPDQYRYIAKVKGLSDDPLAKAQIDKEVKRAAKALDPNLADDTPPDELPLGITYPAFWKSVRTYDAPAVAKALPQPLLVLQGGRDYQVTAADDLPLWAAALAGKPGSSTKLYPHVNHAFVPGDGMATPQEYETSTGHVDPGVVVDIAKFVQAPR